MCRKVLGVVQKGPDDKTSSGAANSQSTITNMAVFFEVEDSGSAGSASTSVFTRLGLNFLSGGPLRGIGLSGLPFVRLDQTYLAEGNQRIP